MCILCQLGVSTLQSRLNFDSRGALLGSDSSSPLNASSKLADPLQPILSASSSSSSSSSSGTIAAQQVASVTTDLILDFDGGSVQTGQGYDLPPPRAYNAVGTNFTPFRPFDRSDGSPGNLNEQILQIVAGVRQDFANFNVRVIWDDRGVNSPLYDNNDTVVLIVDERVGFNGIASNVDVPASLQEDGRDTTTLQSRRDIAFAFRRDSSSAFSYIRSLINTITHEAGHTFGLSHSEPDDSLRAIMTPSTDQRNPDFDSRFSTQSLVRSSPEGSESYTDVERLNQAVGAVSTLPGDRDRQSSQTLPREPNTPFIGAIPSTVFLPANGTIDFLGDRDAFRFQVSSTERYTLRQLAASGSLLNPVVTLWNVNGDFAVVGTGAASTITFDAVAGETYYAVAGSDVDRGTTFINPTTNASVRGNLPVGQTGTYVLQIGTNLPPIAVDDRVTTIESIPITSNVLTNDIDSEGNALFASLIRGTVNGNLVLNPDGSFTYVPNSGFFGSDSFSYQASDGQTASNPATVFLAINEASLTDLIGTPGRDVLVGTDKRDRIIGLQSGDILTGGKGRDQFVFQSINEGGDQITDFTVGEDRVVLSGVLQSINYQGLNPIADGVISFRQASPNLAILQIDPDGSNNATFRPAPFILFDNLSVAALSDPSNFIV